jgi:hypothetical protein
MPTPRPLDALRHRMRGESQNSAAFDASLEAAMWSVPAVFAAYGLATGAWGWAALVAPAAVLGALMAYVFAYVFLGLSLPERWAEVGAWLLTAGGGCALAHGTWGRWALLPLATSVGLFGLLWWSKARETRAADPGLPDAVAEALARLPASLEAALRDPIDRALADFERLDRALADELPVDTAVLRGDAHATLAGMAERARLAHDVAEARRERASATLDAAFAAAVADLGAQAAQMREVLEAVLVYRAARAPENTSRLREKAEALRLTAAGLAEIHADVESR